jgi:hypothetical protein
VNVNKNAPVRTRSYSKNNYGTGLVINEPVFDLVLGIDNMVNELDLVQ